jgi:mRNA deadenylase 3'-5' endonuclease subunit Ccr4
MQAAKQIIQALVHNGKDGGALAIKQRPPIFRSAYDIDDPLHVTNKTPTFVDVLDYIFYASPAAAAAAAAGSRAADVQLVKAHPVRSILKDADASIEAEEDIPDLPYKHWPSDHLLLRCDFQISF